MFLRFIDDMCSEEIYWMKELRYSRQQIRLNQKNNKY